jgi:DNA helicase IV
VRILTYIENPIDETNYELMIIGPSKLFLHSISQVLPSLNIKNIPQRTFSDWALLSMGYRDIQITDDTFFEIQPPTKDQMAHARSKYKGSLKFKEILDRLADLYRFRNSQEARTALNEGLTAYPTGAGSLGMFYGVSSSTIRDLIDETSTEPVNVQRDNVTARIVQLLHDQHDQNYDMWLIGIKNNLAYPQGFTPRQIETWQSQLQQYGRVTDDNYFISVSETQNRALRSVKDELQKTVNEKFERHSPLEIYVTFLKDIEIIERILGLPWLRNQLQQKANLLKSLKNVPKKLANLTENLHNLEARLRTALGTQRDDIRAQMANIETSIASENDLLDQYDEHELEDQISHIENNIRDKEQEAQLILSEYATVKSLREEDIAPLMYLHQLFNGQRGRIYNHIIVDEAQDMSPFQIYMLRNATATASMTLLGDIAQSIHSYRGINHWDELEDVFSNDPLKYEEINISYRSTFEITSFANKILEKLNQTTRAEPFKRHGENVTIEYFQTSAKQNKYLQDLIQVLTEERYKSIALICRNEVQCNKLKKSMKQIDVHIISSKVDTLPDGNSVYLIPIYNTKGLEFEAVVLVDVNTQSYQSEFEGRLLYVGTTRALHRLDVTCVGRLSRFLSQP